MRKREKKTRSVKMESSCSRLMVLSVAHATLILIGVSSNGITMASSSQFTAMFCFGDSLTDNGNNNYLTSLAKANYVPYGVDFYEGPSGRFSNGRTIIDYLGDLVGIPYLPAFANPLATGKNILRGVNFASAAAGILEETGRNLGQRFSLSQQVENFENTLSQLKNEMSDEEISQYLFKSLAIMILGSNDYINNYMVPSQYATSYIYNPKEYADLLIERYATQILLNSKYPEAIFVYGNTYGAFGDILNNPTAYGFKVIDKGCCGIGRNQGQITCLPFSSPCIDRNQYVFWDAFHPTQAVNQILARRAYNGLPSDCYPVNVQQMAQM
ncbi:GDSL esterase/lipase At5g08460-like isoform X2 [Actinidia eriantha]|uniref:GDSL esterase/lipase At5g08460-like isoform X2 n=1 Tax=Actinidia eriantha TaxID=165200 RepID=UPI0025853AC4|nr:GDSL esterase/lipase At5g08460-like isoform X2 [Actinidia eriantha]